MSTSAKPTAAAAQDAVKLLPQSELWDVQRSWYERHALEAYRGSKLAHWISSNSFIADKYANLCVAYANDCWKSSDAGGAAEQEPINIVEIGAGHGKMGFLILKHLLRLREFWPAPGAFRYVLTDCCQQSLDFWKSHPALQTFLKSGLCDYALFDAEVDTEIRLERAGTTISRTSKQQRPMIVVANYVFSALRKDYFQIFGDKSASAPLLRAHCSLDWQGATPARDGSGSGVGTSADDDEEYRARPDDSVPKTLPDSLDGCSIQWEYRAVEPDARGDDGPASVYGNRDPILGRILSEYVDASRGDEKGADGKTGKDYSLAIPIGATNFVRNVSRMCPSGQCLLIIGDKAWGEMSELQSSARDPHVVLHGSVSFMVNMHALRRYVEELGGFALRGKNSAVGFKVEAYLLGGHTKVAFPKLRRKWRYTMEDIDPDSFNKYQRFMREETETPTLKSCLSLLRISHWDSELFFRMRHYIINQSPLATRKQSEDMVLDAEKVWSNVYALDPKKDIAFELGRVMMGIKEYQKAMTFFGRSNATCGEHHITFYNLGICSHYLGQYVLAVGFFDETLSRCPDYVHAQTWKDKSLAAEAGKGDAADHQSLSAEDGGVLNSSNVEVEVGTDGDTVSWTHQVGSS